MYKIKDTVEIKVNKTIASEIIGLTRQYLTDILNGKKNCKKYLAYAIVKYIDEEAEILDYFERVE